MNELNTGDGYKKLTTVAALNRCYWLVHEAGGIPVLVNLLEEGAVERIMVASAIRAAGPQGDSTLVKVMVHNYFLVAQISSEFACQSRCCICAEMEKTKMPRNDQFRAR